MSLGGSLMTNQDSTPSKNGKKVQITPSSSRPNPPKTLESVPLTGNGSVGGNTSHTPSRHRKKSCLRSHMNSLWSVWYGFLITGLNVYIALQCTKRFLDYIELAWPISLTPPKSELHAYIILTGTATVLLPFFLATAVFKVGNLANDGFKIGQSLSTCSVDPACSVRLASPSVLKAFWRHSGPTCVILHIVIAVCLLLPKLMMEARLIQAGFLSKDYIWKTDLDFLISQADRMVILSFITGTNSTGLNSSLSNAGLYKPKSLPLTAGLPGQDIVIKDEQHVWGSISIEFLNYALALFVYAVRYPSVYWNTNKWFGTLFSLQLLVNGYHTLLSYTGVSILYKIHVLGPTDVLPHLQHRLGKFQSKFGTPFVLDRYVTLALFLMTVLLVLSSSLVLYLYGYGRLTAFLNRERARRVIKLRSQAAHGYGYFTHCAALCCLLAISVCQAPLLYDLILVYRASLDGAILACILGAILHLFLWVLLWLILTIKQHWVFKIRVTIGRATVKSQRSIKLMTDVDLVSSSVTSSLDDPSAPLLVVGNGRTYAIAGDAPKRTIMNVIAKNAMEMRARSNHGESSSNGTKLSAEDTEEQIYWLRPKCRSPPHGSPDSSDEKVGWFSKRSSKDAGEKNAKKNKKKGGGVIGSDPEDDGDYARLRELPLATTEQSDDTGSEDNKLLDRVERELLVPSDPSPLLTPEPLGGSTDDLDLPPPPPTPPLPSPPPPLNNIHYMDNQQSMSAQFLSRTDSGMPHEDNLTPRGSDSESGGSPPNSGGSNNSESSSGVHSNSSGAHSNSSRDSAGQRTLRSTSVDNIAREGAGSPKTTPQWRSFSLQRGMQPPTSQTYGVSLTQQSPQPIYSGVKVTPTGPILMNGGVPQMINGGVPQMINGGVPNHMNGGIPQSIYGSIPPTMQPIYGNSSIYKPQQIYASTNKTPVITEGVEDTTVVIMRKNSTVIPPTSSSPTAVKVIGGPANNFGRATNMKMTSFTDTDTKPGADRMSATLPHFPTQATGYYNPQHCLTMPAQHSHAPPSPAPADRLPLFPNTSCNSFPRPHSSIPSHHNGVKLFNQNPYTRRHVQFSDGGGNKVPAQSHHTFPQLPNLTINYAANGNYGPVGGDKSSARDSANFSMTSNESA